MTIQQWCAVLLLVITFKNHFWQDRPTSSSQFHNGQRTDHWRDACPCFCRGTIRRVISSTLWFKRFLHFYLLKWLIFFMTSRISRLHRQDAVLGQLWYIPKSADVAAMSGRTESQLSQRNIVVYQTQYCNDAYNILFANFEWRTFSLCQLFVDSCGKSLFCFSVITVPKHLPSLYRVSHHYFSVSRWVGGKF